MISFDLSSFNAANVTILDNAFRSTSLLETLNLSSWITNSVMSNLNAFLATNNNLVITANNCLEGFLRTITPGTVTINVIPGTVCP